MLIRFYVIDSEDGYDNATLIQACRELDYGKFMEMLSYTKQIRLNDGIIYKIFDYYFNPAVNSIGDVVSYIDVYCEEI